MDETTHTPNRQAPASSPGSSDPLPAASVATQDALPFDQLPPVALPYDDEADRPVGFSLTARARREIAPHDLPPLRVVDDDDGAIERPNDTRPARARALRRAGASIEDITRQLEVDDLVARAWVGEVAPGGSVPSRRRTPRAHGRHLAAATSLPVTTSLSEATSSVTTGAIAQSVTGEDAHDAEEDGAFDEARAVAARDGRWRLEHDAAFAAGVGLLAALAKVDRHAITVATDRAELAGAVMAWLCRYAAVTPGAVRVVLRLGGRRAADLERHRWASELGIPLERVSYTRGSGLDATDRVEALLRVHDPDLASQVAGWCDALLQPADDPADVAF